MEDGQIVADGFPISSNGRFLGTYKWQQGRNTDTDPKNILILHTHTSHNTTYIIKRPNLKPYYNTAPT